MYIYMTGTGNTYTSLNINSSEKLKMCVCVCVCVVFHLYTGYTLTSTYSSAALCKIKFKNSRNYKQAKLFSVYGNYRLVSRMEMRR